TFQHPHRPLAEPLDDEYVRHIQWAHLCHGGAGGGMRWPKRTPHSLTRGMREAQRSMAALLPLIDWNRFRRRNWNEEIRVDCGAVRAVGCGDQNQALLWLVRTGPLDRRGMLRRDATPITTRLELPCLSAGRYCITAWDTLKGRAIAEFFSESNATSLALETPPLVTDMALAIRATA